MKRAKPAKKTYRGRIISGRGVGTMTIDGKKVFDAKKPLHLEVNLTDIRHSHPMDPGSCAAAVAAMRQEKVSRAFIYRSKAYIERDDHYDRYNTPRALRTELVAFDRGGSFEEGRFTLGTVNPSQRREARKAVYRLQVPGGKTALPTKSTWKKYKNKNTGAGVSRQRHVTTKVRPVPNGFNRT